MFPPLPKIYAKVGNQGVQTSFIQAVNVQIISGDFPATGAINRITSLNNPNTYIDLSSGISIVVSGEERVNYG